MRDSTEQARRRLEEIAAALGIGVEALIDRNEAVEVAELDELLALWDAATDAGRQQVMDVLRRVAYPEKGE